MIVEEKRASDFNCCQRTKQTTKHCEGSRCMAWRWAVDKVLVKDDDPEAVASEYYTQKPSTTHGYCGLAGRP